MTMMTKQPSITSLLTSSITNLNTEKSNTKLWKSSSKNEDEKSISNDIFVVTGNETQTTISSSYQNK